MIPLHKVLMSKVASDEVVRTLHSGLITEGPRVKEFEARLEGCFGTPVLATNSCTSAIDLALHLCNVGPGDEVIAPPMTCAATTTHVVLRRAKVVWADVDCLTGLIDPGVVSSLVTARTKAILVVDWGGRPVNCELIRRGLASDIPIIQDAAHSFGASFEDGYPAHSDHRSGTYVAWSFQAIKHLTTGDGGALKVPPSQLDRARRLRWFGIDRDAKVKFRFLQDITEAGYKYHMNDVAATLGLGNFDVAVSAVGKHRNNAKRLSKWFKDLVHITPASPLTGSSWWFYSLLVPDPNSFIDFAEARGVAAGPVHGRCDNYTAHGRSSRPLPGVDYYFAHHVAIPCGWWLNEEDLLQVAETVIAFDKQL